MAAESVVLADELFFFSSLLTVSPRQHFMPACGEELGIVLTSDVDG